LLGYLAAKVTPVVVVALQNPDIPEAYSVLISRRAFKR
jgi:hypothetical protein